MCLTVFVLIELKLLPFQILAVFVCSSLRRTVSSLRTTSHFGPGGEESGRLVLAMRR